MGGEQGPGLAVCSEDGCYANYPLKHKLGGVERCADHREKEMPVVMATTQTEVDVYRDAFGEDYERYVKEDL